MPLGPLDWTGTPFLILYVTLFVMAALISLVAPALLRPAGRASIETDPDALALLAGGRTRLFDAATTRLLAAGTLRMQGKRFALAGRHDALPITGEVGWSDLTFALRNHAAAMTARLQRDRLLIDRWTLWRLRCWATLPFVALFLFGATKWFMGEVRERPVEYLVACLLGTAIVAAVRLAMLDRRTHAGRDAVARARSRHARLSRAPTRAEMGLGVALFGTGVLAGSEFGDFHKLRNESSGGGGDGGSDGDSGGGCGGCGGD